MMSTTAGVSVLVTSTVSRVNLLENFVERTAAEEFSEHLFRITEHEREAAEDEVVLERIMLRVSSSVMVVVICFIVS